MKRIELAALLLFVAAPYAGASTIVVNDTADSVGNNGRCSLREAITAANTGLPSGAAAGECGQGVAAPYDRIEVPAGDYRLTRAGTGEDNNVDGDLDVLSGSLHIVGAGADVVTIRGDREERVLDIGTPSPAGSGVRIGGVTIRNGDDETGGGIRTRAGSWLALSACALSNNTARTGGAIYAADSLLVNGCTFHGNSATSPDGAGGGALYYENETHGARIYNTTFNANESATSGSVAVFAGGATLNNVTASENIADADFDGTGDGAIVTKRTVAVSNSIIARNVDLSVAIGGPNNPDCLSAGAILWSNQYNLIGAADGLCNFQPLGGDQVGTVASPLDPKLEPLGIYGGTIETQPPKITSAAIDRGNPVHPDVAPACEGNDARGINRAEVSGRCDVGAVETTERIFADDFGLRP